jgi:hypothetical protein
MPVRPNRKRRNARDSYDSSNDEGDDLVGVSGQKQPRLGAAAMPSTSGYPRAKQPTATAAETSVQKQKLKPSTTQLPPDYDEPARAWPALMSAKIELICQRYHMTQVQMQSELSEELFFKLEALQAGDRSVTVSKSEIFSHLMQVAKQFHHFALLHR